jgi:hypothetical protein
VVIILNKYTKYSKVEKEGYNYISFIEYLITTLGLLLNMFYLNEETKVKLLTKKLKVLFFINLILYAFKVSRKLLI